ncbi:hypothetical protein [Streptomyces sp. NPDC013489]|uniref:hypothetical protein n=1 Tax=Streptomyces sp. NPDC013489 TaxID=3155606 RepID=UPI0033F09B30
MKSRMWSDGPVGDEPAASGGLLRLLGGAGSGTGTGTEAGGAGRRIVTGPLVCRYCDGDRFEVTSYECFCEGCCLPLDVQDDEDGDGDGDGCGGADPVVRELRPPTAAAPGEDTGGDTCGALNTDTDTAAAAAPRAAPSMVKCPAGHDLFQVAAAYTLDPDGRMRRLSVGLRCPVDGALGLLVDDVRIPPAPVR